MKAGTVDLLNSERGVLCVVLVLASTVLVALGKITGEAWLSYTQWIAAILVTSKTITGAVETLRGGAPEPPIPVAKVISPS